MKKLLLSAAALTLLFASCKKDDGGSSLSRKDQLMSGKWMVTAQTSTVAVMGVSNTTDEYASFDACEKDDLTIFKSDMHLFSDEGAVKCSSSNPQQTDEGTWALTNSDNKLSLTDGTTTLTADINELNGNTLVLSFVDTETTGGVTATYTQKVTYTHVN